MEFKADFFYEVESKNVQKHSRMVQLVENDQNHYSMSNLFELQAHSNGHRERATSEDIKDMKAAIKRNMQNNSLQIDQPLDIVFQPGKLWRHFEGEPKENMGNQKSDVMGHVN